MTRWLVLAAAVGVAAGILSATQRGKAPQTERQYLVCEVLADLKTLNGKIISVRGTVTGGGQGAFLVGKCPSHLVVNGFTWPDAIWLAFPSRSGIPFEADLAAYQRAQATVNGLHPRDGDEVVMTYVGIVETDDLAKRTFLDRQGKPVGIGFGAQNVAPAQLTIKTVRDATVVRKSARTGDAFGQNTRSPRNALLLNTSSSAVPGQVASVDRALESGLRWYYRWIEPVPTGLDAIPCSVAYFEKRSFAFCHKGPLAIDMEMPEAAPPRVTSIVPIDVSFEDALKDFLAHRGPAGLQFEPTRAVSIPVRDLVRCDVDWEQTNRAAAAVLNESQRVALRGRGVSFRYPLVCQGDPFYLLYLMNGDRIRSVWQFTIGSKDVDFSWSYDLDSKQREIPDQAVENLKKDMWYQTAR